MADNNKQKVIVEIDTRGDDAVAETRKVADAVTKALPDLAAFEKKTKDLFNNTERSAKELMETLRELQRLQTRTQMGQLTKTAQMYGRGGIEGIVEDSVRQRRSRRRTTGVEKDMLAAEKDYANALKERAAIIRKAIRQGVINQPTKSKYSAQEINDISRAINQALYQADGSRGQKNQKYLINPKSPAGREFRQQVGEIITGMGRDWERAQKKMLDDRIDMARTDAKYEDQQRSRLRRQVDSEVRKNLNARKAAILGTSDPTARDSLINQATADAEARARTRIPNYNVDRAGFNEDIRRADETRAGREQARQNKAAAARAADPRSPVQKAVDNTLERVNYMGGSGLFRIQASLLANYAVMSGVISGLRFLGTYSVDLEKNLAELQAIASATDSEMRDLSDTIMKVSENSNIAAGEITKAATVMAQAGLSARDIKAALPSIIDLAIGTGTDLADTVDIVTSTLSVFQLQTSQTAEVANVLTAVMNKSKLGIDKFALGVQYAGNIANQQNVTFDELAAAMGGMADSGIRAGSTLGTGLRQLLIDLQAPTNKAKAVFERLGLSVTDLDVKTYGLLGVMRNLRDAGFDGADALEAFEVRAAAAYGALVNDLPGVERLNEEILGTTAATEAAGVQMETLAAKATKFSNTVGNAFAKMAEPFQEGLKRALDFLQPVVQAMGDIAARGTLVGTALQFAFNTTLVMAISTILKRLSLLVLGLLGVDIQTKANTVSTVANTAAIDANTGALAANAAAQAGATRGAGALLSILKPGPLLLFSAAIAGIVLALDLMSGKSKTVKKSLDEVHGTLNQLDAALTGTQQDLDALRAAKERVIERAYALDKGGRELTTTINQLTSQFGSMGFELINTSDASDGLIQSLTMLEERMLRIRGLQAQAKSQTLIDEQGILETTLASQKKTALFGGAAMAGSVPNVSLGPDFTNRQRQAFGNLDVFGGRYVSSSIYINPKTGSSKMEYRPTSDYGNFGGTVVDDYRTLTGVKRELENRILSDGAAGLGVDGLEDKLKKVEAILNTLSDTYDTALKLEMNAGERKGNERDLAINDFTTSLEYQGIAAETERLQRDITEQRKTIQDMKTDGAGRPVGEFERYRMMAEAAKVYLPRQSMLEEQKKALAEGLVGKPGVDGLYDAQAIIDSLPFAQALARSGKALRSSNLNLNPDAQKNLGDTLAQSVGLADDKIKIAQLKASMKDRVPEEQARKDLSDLIDERATYVIDKFLADLRKDGINSDSETGQVRRTLLDQELDQYRQEQNLKLARAYSRPGGGGQRGRDELDAEVAGTRARVKNLKAQLTTIRQGVDAQSSPEQVQTALDQWTQVFGLYQEARKNLTDLLIQDANYTGGEGLVGKLQSIRDEAADEVKETQAQGINSLTELRDTVRNKVMSAAYGQRRKNSEATFKNMLDTLNVRTVEEFKATLESLDAVLSDVLENTRREFETDPQNADRLDNPMVKQELAGLLGGVRARASEAFFGALTSYRSNSEYSISQRADAAAGRRRGLDSRRNAGNVSNVQRALADFDVQDAEEEKLKEIVDLRKEELSILDERENAIKSHVGPRTLEDEANTQAELRDIAKERLQVQRDLTDAVKDYNEAIQEIDEPKLFKGLGDALKDIVTLWNKRFDESKNAVARWADGINGAVEEAQGGFSQFLRDVATNSASAEDAFRSFTQGVLESLLKIATDEMARYAFELLFKAAASFLSPGAGAGDIGNNVHLSSSNIGHAVGGINTMRDSVPTYLRPGEVVMRKSAVDMVGEDRLLELNALGNRRLSGVHNASSGFVMSGQREPDMVNVYLVKDKPQQLSKKDIVVAIADDIQKGGSVKQLIKSVQMGQL